MGGCVSVQIEEDKSKKSTRASSVAPNEGLKNTASKGRRQSNRGESEGGAQARQSDEKLPTRISSEKGGSGQKDSSSSSSKSKSTPVKHLDDVEVPDSENDSSGVLPAKRMKLKELQFATSNFDESLVLGEGSFGKVYKGYLEEVRGDRGTVATNVELAVKKLNPQSFQGYDEWLAEVLFLDKLRHPNLVRLVGYCAENGEALLAYELCRKGALDQVFFSEDEDNVLTWEQRVRIALDAAQGLAYLHEKNVIHRDFKPSNILLGDDMVARLTDFGMAKEGPEGGETHVSTRVMGTMGYLDPAYMQTGRLTRKSDTYSYGVLLLELLTGKRSHDENLTRWARPLLNQRKPDIQQLIDPRIEDKYSKVGATKLAILAKHCLDDDPVTRPEMKVIVESLKRIVSDA